MYSRGNTRLSEGSLEPYTLLRLLVKAEAIRLLPDYAGYDMNPDAWN